MSENDGLQIITPMSVARVTPGAVLGRDVRDANGRLLMATGSTLTEEALAMLARRGVRVLAVVQRVFKPELFPPAGFIFALHRVMAV